MSATPGKSTGKILKDDLRYLMFAEIFQRFDEPKKKRKAFSLIEIAIQCFDKKGFANVTLEMIAREAGVTRQALGRYFEDLDDVREVTLKYIRVLGQQLALELIGKTKDPVALLRGYVEVHFKWVVTYRAHARVWLSFLSSCAKRDHDRDLNMQAITTGNERIVQLVQAGVTAGVYRCSDIPTAAKLVQTLITGWTITLLTEEVADTQAQTEAVLGLCLTAVGHQPRQV